jgi:hypothetical protein
MSQTSNKNNTIKVPKIKIPPQDLKSFLSETMEIDPFWYDLYGIDNIEERPSKNIKHKFNKND